jgi:hypothetical protein
MAKITMDVWISEVVNDTTKDGPITAIMCFHKDGTREQEVFSVRINPGEKIDCMQVANMFMRKASTHVQGIAGYQQFFLYAHYFGRTEWQARLPFQIENASDLTHGTTEPPTAEGRVQQNMRHGESAYQFFTTQAINLAKIQNELLRDLAADRRSLVQENADAIGAFKEILLQNATRQQELEIQKRKTEREAQLYGAAQKYGPHLLNAALGREVIPTAVADNGLIEGLLEALNPKTMEQIQALDIPPELKAAFIARATDHWKKKLEAEQLAMAALEGRNEDPVSH